MPTPRRVTAAPGLALSVALLVSAAAHPTPIRAQGNDEADALMASLLQVEDLPAGFMTLGPEEGSELDIDSAAFSRFGGRRVVSQAWSSEKSGVVFDFRMELPSPEAAAGYLEEAEPTLSEADVTGLALETDEPDVGEDARHYAGVTRVGDAAIAFDNYLFHVGPVAAKVFVASVDLPEGEARRLAGIAAGRMGPLAAPALAPETPAGETPALSRRPSPSPPLAGRLAALVPEAIAASCRPFESGTAGEVDALTCAVDDDLVVYSELGDAAALSAAFESVIAGMPDDDLAASCAEGPHVGPYVDGTIIGRVACWHPPGEGLALFWTDESELVLGGLLAATDDHRELDARWRAALLR
jgi:hypothetical protein